MLLIVDNCRSISNLILTGISKVLERPFLSRFLAHILAYPSCLPPWLFHCDFSPQLLLDGIHSTSDNVQLSFLVTLDSLFAWAHLKGLNLSDLWMHRGFENPTVDGALSRSSCLHSTPNLIMGASTIIQLLLLSYPAF